MATLLLLAGSLAAQRVMVDNFDQLTVHYATPQITTVAGDYLTLSADGYILGGEVGAPALPMLTSLLAVPFCDGMEVVVENARYDTLPLPAGRVMPLQPSRSKSDRSEPVIILDEQVYATDAYFSRPLAKVTPLGMGRDRNYAVLTWSPVSVNPVSGMMTVCRYADVTVRYLGSDAGLTMKHYELYHTPSFSLGTTINTLFTNAKDIKSTAPVRMVIMAAQGLQCTALTEFAAWKRKQGMLVDLVYVADNSDINTLAAQLQQMYDDATTAVPAPTYLLLVGDIDRIPAFDSHISYSSINDHITDLYYTTWSPNDDLPDCYWGRFSATDTTTLRDIVEKTLFYEQYRFFDDSYLTRAVLISGVDQGDTNYTDNAGRYSDPTMDYAAYYYVNTANGFNTVYYYKNDVDFAPEGVTVTGSSMSGSTASALRSLYNNGMGWINYSAHGYWNEWSDPEFTVTDVSRMHNTNMPSFMIGNCCLSNKFDRPKCFGEALLRKGNYGGAIGYIGATNSTMWTEDFYWSVGLRNNISHTMSPVYDANRMGSYDRLFHTHNEALTAQMVTAGQLVAAGNMSVNRAAGTSSWATAAADYYWEIYELMGDPSLLPWLGRAANITGVTIVREGNKVKITTVPGSYVALVCGADNELVGSAFANNSGLATLTVSTEEVNNCNVSIMAQGYKPYYKAYGSHSVGLQSAEESTVMVSPNPASGRCEVSADGLQSVTMLNVMGQTLQTVSAQDGRCTVGLTSVPAGLYLLRLETASGSMVRKLVVK